MFFNHSIVRFFILCMASVSYGTLCADVDLAANKRNTMIRKYPVELRRNYNLEVTECEKNDIAFIVTTLANCTLTKIWRSKPALEKAGDRIDHIHPLKFLMTIFNDERLKVCLHVIKTRGWVWKEFFSNTKDSLSNETRLDNMRPECVCDFANRVGIDVRLIQAAIYEQRWNDFIEILIQYLPRKDGGGRYDI